MSFEVGDFYTINGKDVYQVVATLNEPGVVFENIETKVKTSMVGQSSMVARGFTRLIPEKEDFRTTYMETFIDDAGATWIRKEEDDKVSAIKFRDE